MHTLWWLNHFTEINFSLSQILSVAQIRHIVSNKWAKTTKWLDIHYPIIYWIFGNTLQIVLFLVLYLLDTSVGASALDGVFFNFVAATLRLAVPALARPVDEIAETLRRPAFSLTSSVDLIQAPVSVAGKEPKYVGTIQL